VDFLAGTFGHATGAALIRPDARLRGGDVISQPFSVTQILVNLGNQRPRFGVSLPFRHRIFKKSKGRARWYPDSSLGRRQT